MRFGGSIFVGKTNRSGIAFCGNPTKRQDGEGQKDEPPRNGALNIRSLKEQTGIKYPSSKETVDLL